MTAVCNHCQAKRYIGESPGMCCSNGKVRLPPLNPPPDPLMSYMSGTSAESKHFLQNIRKYNSCFRMTSFGVTSTVEDPGFMPTFKIQGQPSNGCVCRAVPWQRPSLCLSYFAFQASYHSVYCNETKVGADSVRSGCEEVLNENRHTNLTAVVRLQL
jgi:hypothetical protein